MAAMLVVDGLDIDEINRSYKAICDANRLASAFCINYRGEKIISKAKLNKQKTKSSFVFEAIPVAAAIRYVPKLYNGSEDPIIVASDHRDLMEYVNYYFDWEAERTKRIERIETRYGVPDLKMVNSMLEPLREITEAYPFHFGKIINGRRKDDNIAHVLCTRKANDFIKRETKKMVKRQRRQFKAFSRTLLTNFRNF